MNMFKWLENGIKGSAAFLIVLVWLLLALAPTLIVLHFVIKYW